MMTTPTTTVTTTTTTTSSSSSTAAACYGCFIYCIIIDIVELVLSRLCIGELSYRTEV
jgi:hypothetical protein